MELATALSGAEGTGAPAAGTALSRNLGHRFYVFEASAGPVKGA